MAVLQRVRFISQERVDLPDLLNLDAFGNADWSAFVNSFITGVNSPFVVTGFDITDPEALINVATSTVDINIANGVLFNPESTGGAGAFYIGPPTAPAQAVFLTANATNFIEVDQTTSLGAVDTRAIWDAAGGPDGTGQEFSQAIDTVTNLDVAIFGNTVGFTSGRAPIAKIVVNSFGVITSITDCRDLLFRLGTGGATPNPAFVYPWPQTQTDNPVTLTSSVGANPFQGADKAIMSLKDWMNAVMTEIGRVKGNGVPWFASVTESGSFTETFLDAVGSVLTSGTGAGTFNWNAGTNTLTWSDDLYVRTVAGGPYFFVIKAGSGTLNTGEVLWLQQVRDTPLPDNVPLSFTNGSSYVNVSSPGAFTGLVSDATAGSGFGDWIRKEIDNPDKYGRILNFYAGANGSGGVTTAAAALSVHLSGNYTGTTSGAGGDLAFYAAGSYTVTNTAALGLPWSTQNYWLATRWGTGTSQCYVRDSGILKNGETRIVGYEIPESLELTGNLTVDGNTNITGTLSGTGGTLDVTGMESVSGSSATALLDSANTGAGASIEADSSGGTGPGGYFKGNATRGSLYDFPQAAPGTPLYGDQYTDSTSKMKKFFDGINFRTMAEHFVTIGDGTWTQGDFTGAALDTQINAAIASMTHGGTIFVQNGNYTMTTGAIINANHIRIVFDAGAIVKAAAATFAMFTFSALDGWLIGANVDQAGRANVNSVVITGNAASIHIEKCNFQNSVLAAVISAIQFVAGTGFSPSDIWIKDNVHDTPGPFIDLTWSATAASVAYFGPVHIVDNDIASGATTAAINMVADASGAATVTSALIQWMIRGNWIGASSGNGINIGVVTGAGGQTATVQNCVITGNQIGAPGHAAIHWSATAGGGTENINDLNSVMANQLSGVMTYSGVSTTGNSCNLGNGSFWAAIASGGPVTTQITDNDLNNS